MKKLRSIWLRSNRVRFGVLLLTFFALFDQTLAGSGSLREHIASFETRFPLTNGKVFLVNGVNCHSTSFNSAGLLNYPTYVNGDEFNYVMDNYCEKQSAPSAGAIAAVDRTSPFSHSYFHIDQNTVFEKKGMLTTEPYLRLKRGAFKNVEYFKCQRPQFDCPALNSIKNRIRLVGLYYANIAIGKGESKYLGTFFDYAKMQNDALDSLNVSSASCRNMKQILKARIMSLLDWGYNLNSTYYLQRIPRGPKI